jgi:hypothetical protein
MAYDDTPLYQQNKDAQKAQVVRGGLSYLYPTATHPSPIYSWYWREYDKRSKGQQNEIDENEIKAAAKGVKNKWHARYWSDPKKFQPIIENRSYDWNEIINYCVK